MRAPYRTVDILVLRTGKEQPELIRNEDVMPLGSHQEAHHD